MNGDTSTQWGRQVTKKHHQCSLGCVRVSEQVTGAHRGRQVATTSLPKSHRGTLMPTGAGTARRYDVGARRERDGTYVGRYNTVAHQGHIQPVCMSLWLTGGRTVRMIVRHRWTPTGAETRCRYNIVAHRGRDGTQVQHCCPPGQVQHRCPPGQGRYTGMTSSSGSGSVHGDNIIGHQGQVQQGCPRVQRRTQV